MKPGDKVFCKDEFDEFTGWIASIDDSRPYPYNIVEDMGHIGKTFLELRDSVFKSFKLKDMKLLQYSHLFGITSKLSYFGSILASPFCSNDDLNYTS